MRERENERKKENRGFRPQDYTVCGQNTKGIYFTLFVLIQSTDVKQNAANNNWLLKLQPAVKLQSWQKSNFN